MHLFAKHDKQKQEGCRACDKLKHPSPTTHVENLVHYPTKSSDNTSPSHFSFKENPSSTLYKPGTNKSEDRIP